MENNGLQREPVDESAIEQMARMAGITVAPDRLPGAGERLNEMLDFLQQLDGLETGGEPPASVFDPSWEAEPA